MGIYFAVRHAGRIIVRISLVLIFCFVSFSSLGGLFSDTAEFFSEDPVNSAQGGISGHGPPPGHGPNPGHGPPFIPPGNPPPFIPEANTCIILFCIFGAIIVRELVKLNKLIKFKKNI